MVQRKWGMFSSGGQTCHVCIVLTKAFSCISKQNLFMIGLQKFQKKP